LLSAVKQWLDKFQYTGRIFAASTGVDIQ